MDELTISKLAKLPKEKREEVNDFVDFLLTQIDEKKADEKNEVKKTMFGALKGTIIMADDFD